MGDGDLWLKNNGGEGIVMTLERLDDMLALQSLYTTYNKVVHAQ